jgi:hypothetical protein
MFRYRVFSWFISSIVANTILFSVAFAQEKEKDLNHQFAVIGDPVLVKSFETAYDQRFKKSNILAKFCDPVPKQADKGVLIVCKPSSSTSVIGEMTVVFTAVTDDIKPEKDKIPPTLTMIVSSPK